MSSAAMEVRSAIKRICTWLLIPPLLCLTGLPSASIAQTTGERWAPVGPDYAGVYAHARDPFNPQVLVAGAFFGAFIRVG